MMKANLKVNLLFHDRVGIVSDISALLSENGWNIVSMEVHREKDMADVYVEVEPGTADAVRERLVEMLGKISSLVDIRFIESLPGERRENRIQVVLENVSDGVISIDLDGRVRSINRVAAGILDVDPAEVMGRQIRDLNLPDSNIVECLKGRMFNNVKTDFITRKGRYQLFSTGRPIRDASGGIIGAVEIWKDMREIRKLARSIAEPGRITFNDFIGQSEAVKEAVSFAQKIAATDSVVSIRGKSGTGKELFARAIHADSGRSGPFVALNCAALSESLLESELFGYVGGAFTGARKQGKPGLFEVANQGTIFLDEIAEMPPGPQAKILRAIQEKSVRRIGGEKEIPVDSRIITATNQNLERLVEEKRFRQDLYYRINVLPIHLPPLKERPDDIPLLVEHFLFHLASRLHRPEVVRTVTPQALDKLMHHDWPGNVRELRNVIERAAILADDGEIGPKSIVFSYETNRPFRLPTESPMTDSNKTESLPDLIGRYEKGILADTLDRHPSIRKAAHSLGISHTAFLNKMKKYGIKSER